MALPTALYSAEQVREIDARAIAGGVPGYVLLTRAAEAALRVLYAFAKDPRVPRAYGSLVQEQRRLARAQEDARRLWRRG